LNVGQRLMSVKIGEPGVANTFRDSNGRWMAAHFNGLGFDVLPISFGSQRDSKDVVLAMVAPSRNGYLGITRTGTLLNSNGTEEKLDYVMFSQIKRSDLTVFGGNRWIYSATNPLQYAIEFTDQGKSILFRLVTRPGTTDRLQELAWSDEARSVKGWKSFQQLNYRNRFGSVHVSQGKLSLLRNQFAMSLEMTSNGLVWSEGRKENLTSPATTAGFERNDVMTNLLHYRMESAASNQVEVTLDSRGLIHIRSVRHTTEISLIVAHGQASGWTSDGRWFGKPYYTGSNPVTSSDVIEQEVLKPLLAWFERGGD
jgi:hypothetical protein